MDQHLAAAKRRRSVSHSKDRGLLATPSTLEWVARSLEEEEELPSYATCWKALYKLNYNWLMGQPVVSYLSMKDIQHQDRLWKRNPTGSAQSEVACISEGKDDFCTDNPVSLSIPLVQFIGSILATATNTPWGPMVHFWRLVRGGNSDGKAISSEDNTQRLRIEYWKTFVCPKPPTLCSPNHGRSERKRSIVSFELDRSLTRCKSPRQQPSILAMVGYDTGEFTIFEVDSPTNSSSSVKSTSATIREIGTWNHDIVDEKSSKMRSSCFHYPLVVTYCTNGVLSIFRVSSASKNDVSSSVSSPSWCKLLHQMHGRVGESPVEMEVEEIAQMSQQHKQLYSNGTQWLLRLAFGVPLIDGSWTMRLQEFELDQNRILDCIEIGSGSYHHRRRPARPAFAADWASKSDFHQEDVAMDAYEDEEAEYVMEAHSLATVAPIASICLASPYLVTTHRDNTMNVFRIRRRRRRQRSLEHQGTRGSSPLEKPTVEFWHKSTLYGHCGAVSSASIDARLGRLVSASMDRSVKIWRIGKSDGTTDETTSTTSMHRYYHHRDHQRKPVPSASAIAQEMEVDAEDQYDRNGDVFDSWSSEDEDEDDYDPDCLVSMSVNDNSWVRSKKINRDEGVGLAWIGSDDEKIVSVSVDGMIRVWRFT
ncbi:hypothetical protein BGW41_007879 [Actinomortierella wolfii]|nr:hypothetical protein BGW41_007879 [Actinomortierella wolfii]